MGYVVAVTASGQELMSSYEDFKPTTIILDMVMPGLDGNEIILWLAERTCSAQLIIITGFTPDYAEHAKVLAEYKGLRPVITLSKPIEVAELRAVLESQGVY
jgi:DNA-binding response OmpR family regulator